jgi:hypothetical protein
MKAGLPMKFWFRRCAPVLLAVMFASLAPSQRGPKAREVDDQEATLPNGKSQREEILKSEHEQNLKDAAQLADLAQQLREDLEKNDRYVLSIATLKKTDEIEKLVKKIRSRLRHN